MKNKLFTLVLVFVSLVALCACGGDTAVTNNAVDLSDEPTYGGKVVVGITQDMDSLDPHKAVAAGTKEVLYNIFEGLVKPDENGDLVPAVAKEFTISENGDVYSFALRDNVRFHNGEQLTADDVIYSIKRCAGLLSESEEDVQVVPALSVISDIVKTDKGIDVILSEPNTELIGYFTCAIVPEGYKDQNTAPIGTGPFKFVSYTPQMSVELVKNSDYYIDGVPYLDGVTFKISSSADASFMELLGGTIDIFPYLSAEQSAQLGDNYQVLASPMNLVQALFINNAVEPFGDIRVRQAINLAVDRQQVIDMVLGGKGDVVQSAMFSSYKTYYNSELSTYYTRDVEKAKELLKEAGYPDGISFTIKVPSNYTMHIATAQILVEQMKEAGINAKIELIEWASWLSDVYMGRDFEATIVGLDSKLAPGDTLKQYPSDSVKNFINYKSEQFDALYKEAVAAVDIGVKVENYKKLQEILTQDAASVFIQSPCNVVAVSSKLSGYKFYPIYVQDMSTVYFRK